MLRKQLRFPGPGEKVLASSALASPRTFPPGLGKLCRRGGHVLTTLWWCRAGGYVFLDLGEKSWHYRRRHRPGFFTLAYESCAAAAACCLRPCDGAAPAATYSWTWVKVPPSSAAASPRTFDTGPGKLCRRGSLLPAALRGCRAGDDVFLDLGEKSSLCRRRQPLGLAQNPPGGGRPRRA